MIKDTVKLTEAFLQLFTVNLPIMNDTQLLKVCVISTWHDT